MVRATVLAIVVLAACDAGEKPPEVEPARKVEPVPRVEPTKRTDARLHGALIGRDGRPLHATIVIRNNQTMLAGATTTKPEGRYDLIKLQPGEYTLIFDYGVIENNRYTAFRHERQVALRANDDITLDVQVDARDKPVPPP